MFRTQERFFQNQLSDVSTRVNLRDDMKNSPPPDNHKKDDDWPFTHEQYSCSVTNQEHVEPWRFLRFSFSRAM
jgi:hypothetical protein